jgi:hypothetical protein
VYTVYFVQDADWDKDARIFVCNIPTAKLAQHIADQLMDDFDVDLAWGEKD